MPKIRKQTHRIDIRLSKKDLQKLDFLAEIQDMKQRKRTWYIRRLIHQEWENLRPLFGDNPWYKQIDRLVD